MIAENLKVKENYKKSKTNLTAKWLVHTDRGTIECSNCHAYERTAHLLHSDFCPCCGATMKYGKGC